MTRRVALPAETEVRAALTELKSADPDRPPTVLSLARRLGLTNATFWRHFPGIAKEVADARRAQAPSAQPAIAPFAIDTDAKTTIGQLRNEKANLREQLEVAIAHIQHLTLQNRALREQLEQALKVARITPHR